METSPVPSECSVHISHVPSEQSMEEATELPTNEEDASFNRDVRYSLEVWVPVDKVKLFENLNITDRQLLTSQDGWLNGTLIDAAMTLLQYQYPSISGLESSALAIQLDFRRHSSFFVQIINRSPRDMGTHWLVITNLGCQSNEVRIFDSAFDNIPYLEEQVIAKLINTKENELVMQQTNGNDCGLFAIANAITLCLGLNPCDLNYKVREMRGHLIKCLENKELKMFPVHGRRQLRKKTGVKKVLTTELFCICKMPDTHTLYVYCDQCGREYHPVCIGMSDEEAKIVQLYFAHIANSLTR